MTKSMQTQAQDLINQILNYGRDLTEEGLKQTKSARERGIKLAKQGEDYLADKLGVEEDETSRDTLRKGLGLGAAAGAMALLLATRSGRKLAAIGGLAGLGAIAWKSYQKQVDNAGEMAKDAIGNLAGPAAEARAEILIRAMVSAAKIDGNIDAAELDVIRQTAGPDIDPLKWAIDQAPDPASIAKLADTEQTAREIYAISCRIADGMKEAERTYLDTLARAMKLDPELAADIETSVRTG